ncbi:ABC transporter permease [Microbacterium sp. KR10-403]|uniref:ABC transporter permease n=1 Tax=Microbacterium sp. KR10-403 TaxID=3158581 RepID=UPI0032E46EC8
MISYISRRFGLALLSILGASIVAFIVFRVAPGDPARQALGPFASDEQLAQFRADNLLDQSLPAQYWAFIRNFFTGDWGYSYGSGAKVTTLFGDTLAPTIELAVVTFIVTVALATWLALVSTYRPRRWLDRLINALAYVGLGAPAFWVGLVLVLVFSQWLPVLPGAEGQLDFTYSVPTVTGFMLVDTLLAGDLPAFGNAITHLILPVATLGLAVFAYLVRILRASLLAVGDQQFVLAAEAKGVSRWTAFRRHALHNALLPMLTASGIVLGQLLAGTVLVETVFNWPGVGNLLTRSIGLKDYSVVDVFVMLSATAYVLVNFIVDVVQLRVDPRILQEEQK